MRKKPSFFAFFVVCLMISLSAAVLGLAGCTTEAPPPEKTSTESAGLRAEMLDSATLAGLKSDLAEAMGTIPESLYVNESSLGYQDMEFSLEDLLAAKTSPESGAGGLSKTAQVKTNGWNIPQSEISDIRVCTSVTGLLPSTIQYALDMWNSTGSKIGFRLVTGAPCDITIYGGSGAFSDVGYPVQAQFGINGVGGSIRVYPDFATRYTIGNQIFTLMHALGHTIGFGHANSAEEFTARHIAGTPTTDAYSIMATAIWNTWVIPPSFPGGTAQSGSDIWNVMLLGDKMAARILYPLANRQERSHVSDVNGDGRKDLILISDNGVTVAHQNSSGTLNQPTLLTPEFSQALGWNSSYTIAFGDVNGDGRVDIVGFGQNDVVVRLGNGSSFSGGGSWSTEFTTAGGWANYHKTMADVNGDGRADIVGFGQNQVVVRISNGSSFAGSGGGTWSTEFTTAGSWAPYHKALADVNGDGRADIVGFGQNQVVVRLSTGSSFQPPGSPGGIWSTEFTTAGSWAPYHKALADVNGDGRADIVGFGQNQVVVRLSTGSSFQPPGSPGGIWSTGFIAGDGWNEATPRLLADINNDGRADIVGVGYNEWYFAPSTGASFSPAYLALQYRTH